MDRMLFLTLKKVQMVKITPLQIPKIQQKSWPSKIFHCHNWRDPPTPKYYFKYPELPICT